jgi:hypothetical protein
LAAGVVEHIQAIRVGALPHSNLHTQTHAGGAHPQHTVLVNRHTAVQSHSQ